MSDSRADDLHWHSYNPDEVERRRPKKPPGSDKPHKCHLCPRSFDRPSALAQHLLTHTGEKPHVCRFCQLRFTVASNLYRHMRGCPSKPVGVDVEKVIPPRIQSRSGNPKIQQEYRLETGSSSMSSSSSTPSALILDGSKYRGRSVAHSSPSEYAPTVGTSGASIGAANPPRSTRYDGSWSSFEDTQSAHEFPSDDPSEPSPGVTTRSTSRRLNASLGGHPTSNLVSLEVAIPHQHVLGDGARNGSASSLLPSIPIAGENISVSLELKGGHPHAPIDMDGESDGDDDEYDELDDYEEHSD